MVEGQCWCFHEGGISGSSVCGYPDGYSGEYYSIATDSKPSPHTIIKAFGKIPNPTECNLDTKTGCDGNSLSNVCISSAYIIKHIATELILGLNIPINSDGKEQMQH